MGIVWSSNHVFKYASSISQGDYVYWHTMDSGYAYGRVLFTYSTDGVTTGYEVICLESTAPTMVGQSWAPGVHDVILA